MKNFGKTAVIITVVAAMLAGCGPQQEAKKPPDEVTAQLKWIHQAQFAGMYAAEQKGFYAEENIDVTLKPGGVDIPPNKVIADLIAGETSFAIVGGEQLLTARSQGGPVVAIAVIFQKNLYVYVSLKSSGIERPQDLVGKKVMVSPQGEPLHQALLYKLGIDPGAIEHIPYKFDITPLTTGQIDVHQSYRMSLALQLEEAGYELDFIWMDDYGIRLYADTIITTEQLVQQNPELVERFLRATLEGWRYAVENADEAADLVLQYDATVDADYQTRMMEVQIPLIHTGEVEIGWIDGIVWEAMHQMFLDSGVVTQPINVTEAYTMQFLNQIYGEAD